MMRKFRRKLQAVIERAYFYSGRNTRKEAIRENVRRSADKAYTYLTNESASKKKASFISRLVFTLMFFMFGVFLVFNSMAHSAQSVNSSPQPVASVTTHVAQTATSNSLSSTYVPGKGGNDAQMTTHKANANPACDPNKPMDAQIDYNHSCDFNGSSSGQTYSCPFDAMGVDQGAGSSISANCSITNNQDNPPTTVTYYCYLNDWTQSINAQTLNCNNNDAKKTCVITSTSAVCQLVNSNGNTECTATVDPKSLMGLPAPTSTVPLPDATVCPVAIPTCTAATSAGALPDWLTGNNGLLSSTSSATIETNVGNIWQTLRDIALALLVIPFFVAGYQIMISASSSRYAGSIQIITRVFLAGLAVIFSLEIIKMAVDVESVMAQAISSGIPWNPPSGLHPIVVPSDQWSCYAHQFFGGVFNISIYSMQHANNNVSTDQYVQLNYIDMATIVNNLPYYVAVLMSILLAVQLTVRFALICFQAVLSPLVFMCGALPGDMGQMVIRPWIRGFGSLLIVQLLQLMVILLGYMLFSILTTTGWGDNWVTTLFQTLVPIIIIIVTLNIPRMMGSATTNIISMITSSLSGATTGILLIVRGI